MAKPLINTKEIEEKIKTATTTEYSLVKQLRGGLEQAKGFLLEELIKIGTASPSKTIDVNDNNVKEAVQSLIYADPDDPKNKSTGGGALSIIATTKNNEKKIKEWIGKGCAAKAFDEIRKEMQELPDKLQQELSTQESTDNLINERVKNNILKQIPFFIDENNNIRGINAVEKNNFISKINEHIEILPIIVSTLLQDRALLNPLIHQVTKTASEFFGKDGAAVNNACVLDEKKLTTENILNFTEAANPNIKAFEVIQQGLKNLASKMDVTQNQKTTETLLPTIKSALSKLDADYMVKYSDTIINGLQEINNKGTSFWENFKSIFTGKDYLKEKLEKQVDSHVSESNKYIQNKITTFSNALKNDEFVTGLTYFIKENKNKIINNPELTNVNLNEIQNNKSALVELRKINPRAFDEVVFDSSKRLVPNSKSEQIKVDPPQIIAKPTIKNQTRER